MGEWFNSLSGLEQTFLSCAVLGSILFLIRLALQFMGGDVDSVGEDIPDDLGGEMPDGDGGFGDSDISFRFISVQGVTAFIMIFGLVGLAMKLNSGAEDMNALIFAVLAGFVVMFLQARLMTFFLRLQDSGNLNMASAVGKKATVYLDIPPTGTGTGKIRLEVQQRLKVFDAKSANEEELKTGTLVRVTEIISGNVMVVEKLI